MQSLLWAITRLAEEAARERDGASRVAAALLALAGVLLAATVPSVVVRGGMPLGPLLLWLIWMALFGTVAGAVLTLRRARRTESVPWRGTFPPPYAFPPHGGPSRVTNGESGLSGGMGRGTSH